jgi:formate dehydrogenase major subunit
MKLIVIDPREIDILHTVHGNGGIHLQLKPGTNVAMMTSLAHVIVTEGLCEEQYITDRCELDSYEMWKEFVSRKENSPEVLGLETGVDAELIREAARLYAQQGNSAIYYGLGVTEHSQGTTAVMGIANLAMATGNLGKNGAGVNPLRGQNNVQGACDMGSFPHEFPGYRHVSEQSTRDLFGNHWGVELDDEPGLRIPNMLDYAISGDFKAIYIEGEDIAQSDPNTKHVTHALEEMECVIVQDLFLNETAMYAHVFLPGASFLEKSGTFTNAERRINPVRRVMSPKNGYEDWEVTQLLANALGYKMNYASASEILDEIAELTPTFKGVSWAKLRELGSIQWPCNDEHPTGTPIMHVNEFVRGKGKFWLTEYVPTDERVNQRFPLILTTGRILSHYNVGAQTRRTKNTSWHEEDLLEIHPQDAEARGLTDGDKVNIKSRAGQTALSCHVTERVQPGVVYTTFHHPWSGANVITTDNSDWATNCPEFKVTAVEISLAIEDSEWQKQYEAFSDAQKTFAQKQH